MKVILFFFIIIISLNASPLKLRVGVLSYGTVNWELNLLKEKELDKKYGFDLEIKRLASKNGVAIAFAAGDVDIIVNDWIWVNRQKFSGKDLYFYPYSKAVGAIYTNNKKINSIKDLTDKRVGIAGGPVDKTWLLFRAYTIKKYGTDLNNMIDKVFAAPPILNKKIIDGDLDAAINFWHYNARLKVLGMNEIVSLQDILPELGINSSNVPFIGWIFKNEFATKNKELINSFLQASYEAKQILNTNDEEWKNIKDIMNVKDEKTFQALKSGYKNGIPKSFTEKEIEDMRKIYELLAKLGGKKLISNASYLDNSIFWQFTPKISW